jgi:nucleoid DNA-binding protein
MTTIKRKKKAVTKKVTEKVKVIAEKQTRSEIYQAIAEETELKRSQVEAVFSSLSKLVKSHMKKRGSGEVMIPQLGLKLKRVRRNPTKKRKMVSPLTGMEVVIPAKPARDDIKAVALKTLKEAVFG